MTNNQCTEERFSSDVKDHKITIVKEDGLHRHIRLKRPNTLSYYFDLITWPGHLCITGDMGTHVFSRVADMFEFFREERINPGYWGQKLLSVSRFGGFEEFSEDRFKAAVIEDLREWEFESPKQKGEVWRQVHEDVLSFEGEYDAYASVNSFVSEYGHMFEDFFDHSFKEYTFHFIWCLRAIVWGIQKYDEAHAAEEIEKEITQ